jgi:hypothetical protein
MSNFKHKTEILPRERKKKESVPFLKKRSKKLLSLGPRAFPPPREAEQKSFLVTFFQKSNCLACLTYLYCGGGLP